MEETYKVKIECNANQARLMIKALDFFSRIGIGQIEEIDHLLRMYYWKSEIVNATDHDSVNLLEPYKRKVFKMSQHASLSICASQIHDVL